MVSSSFCVLFLGVSAPSLAQSPAAIRAVPHVCTDIQLAEELVARVVQPHKYLLVWMAVS